MGLIEAVLDFLTARRVTVVDDSMRPTLRPGDRAVFSTRSRQAGVLRRGQIVLLRAPDGTDRLDVKRIVGMPGEAIEFRAAAVYVNGRELAEAYLGEGAHRPEDAEQAKRAGSTGERDFPDRFEVQLGSEEFAVHSDNRLAPGASGTRRYGPVSRGRIVGVLSRRF